MPLADADTASYEAGEIAAFAAERPVTAMRVIERGGELFYGGEVEVFVAALPRSLGKHTFLRFEVKCRKREDSPIKNGHHAVLSAHPYSLGWCHFEPFKPPRLESRSNLNMSHAEESELAGALAYLARLDCDYWETSHFRTAGFTDVGQRQSWDGQRDNRRGLLHLLGVCEDANAYKDLLMRHPSVQKLLTETEKRIIRIGSADCSAHGKRVTVHEQVVGEAWELMTLAVRQALAGPHKDGERWVEGKLPVHSKVDRIYRDLLNARNRSVVKQRQREDGPREDW
ncbi:hypothetical protein [Archangium violaceum]|uniref:Uncharacterized protein n=1 Tax=Archangium violaceum Cb vi76 TaxID=1406225 RepID=A0A084SQ30_9BACT|nr:hypothetical protein [Archangium violaceum]KFA90565.1 hypothetical protein Q664_27255 [Archangium violaceum Cb vi76]